MWEKAFGPREWELWFRVLQSVSLLQGFEFRAEDVGFRV